MNPEFDKTISETVNDMQGMNPKIQPFAKPKFNVAIIAIIAAAKFGLPTVEITALYGLFHFTKSTPDICISP